MKCNFLIRKYDNKLVLQLEAENKKERKELFEAIRAIRSPLKAYGSMGWDEEEDMWANIEIPLRKNRNRRFNNGVRR